MAAHSGLSPRQIWINPTIVKERTRPHNNELTGKVCFIRRATADSKLSLDFKNTGDWGTIYYRHGLFVRLGAERLEMEPQALAAVRLG